VLRVNRESRRAEFANGFVLLDVARSAVRTGIIAAGIDALVAPAGQVRRTAPVPQTDEERGMAVLRADADRLVFDHLAGLALVARVVGAGTLAGAGDAGRVGRTLVVGHALRPSGRASDVSGLADDEAGLADADGSVVPDLAPLVGLAGRRVDGARILALCDQSVARQVDGTVDVGQTRQIGGRCVWPGRGAVALRVRLARELRRAEVAFGTGAARTVQDDPAEGVFAARAAQTARVEALRVDARLFVGTVVVA